MRLLPYAIAGLMGLEALSLRARLREVDVIDSRGEHDAHNTGEYEVWTAPGVTVPSAVLARFVAHAKEHGQDVLDLWPPDLSIPRFRLLLSEVGAGRKNPFKGGVSAGQALLVHREVVERSGLSAPQNPVEFARAARRLKRIGRNYGVAVAPELTAIRDDRRWHKALDSLHMGPLAPSVQFLQAAFYSFVALLLVRRPPAGLAIVLASGIQTLIVRPGGSAVSAMLAGPREVLTFVSSFFSPHPLPRDWDEAKEETYAADLAQGYNRFFEERRTDCPLCASSRLKIHVVSPDIGATKPGRFVLERCEACGHVFQNPRLTPEGLEFYYRDAYDGASADVVEGMFDARYEMYLKRARHVREHAQPSLWLDVGTGYGHFCHAAREVLPDTEFHGLDFGSSIHEAEKRGWVSRAISGLFPKAADGLKGQYDIVSMYHYLEHTREPQLELLAAHKVLKPGGYLSIEIPNPETPFGVPFGSFWFSWLQPQHQHFFNQRNLQRLLEQSHFEVVAWRWRDAHVPWMVLVAVVALNRMAPLEAPWRLKPSRLERMKHAAIWGAGAPLLFLAALLDFLTGRLVPQPHWSVNYGVLARRT